jgi:hypothetical protein
MAIVEPLSVTRLSGGDAPNRVDSQLAAVAFTSATLATAESSRISIMPTFASANPALYNSSLARAWISAVSRSPRALASKYSTIAVVMM